MRAFSRTDLRMAAARIMDVESNHRTIARVLAPGLDPTDGGPLRTASGILGMAEAVNLARNNAFARTLAWTTIDQAMAVLLAIPYLPTAGGRSVSQAYGITV
jgi:hypothetical protein